MRYILLTTFTLFLIACSPRYEIKTLYTLPSDIQGRSCVQTCSHERKICQAHCNRKQEQCLVTAKSSATQAYPTLMREYRETLTHYNRERDRYELENTTWQREARRLRQDFEHYRSSCQKNKKNSYECRRSEELKSELHSFEEHEPKAPKRPIKPSLAHEIKNAQNTCSNSCGCDKEYDSCFISCGGSLNYKKFCVENCK